MCLGLHQACAAAEAHRPACTQRCMCAEGMSDQAWNVPGTQCDSKCSSCDRAGAGKCDPGWCDGGYTVAASGACTPVRLHKTCAASLGAPLAGRASAECAANPLTRHAARSRNAVCRQLRQMRCSRGRQLRLWMVHVRLRVNTQWHLCPAGASQAPVMCSRSVNLLACPSLAPRVIV